MQNIQLYIEGNRMDMFKDESVSLTQTIQNVRDIGKIFTNFTKTFSLPASKDNNKIFKHYYNYDIVNGFDARIKKNSTIELNYMPFEKGKIKLEGVDMKNNKPYAYRITFFGNTVDLKDLLGEDNLDALTWLNNFTIDYDATEVLLRLQSGYDKVVDSVTYSDAIIAPLISHSQRLYYDSSTNVSDTPNLAYPPGGGTHHHGVLWSDLKYGIRVHLIIKAIENEYGLSFSTDFFNTTNDRYHNLYLWMQRKKGNLIQDDQTFTSQVTGFAATPSPVYVSSDVLGQTLTVERKITNISLTTLMSDTSVTYDVLIFRNGNLFSSVVGITGNQTALDMIFIGSLEDGNLTVFVRSNSSVTFNTFTLGFDDISTPAEPNEQTISATNISIVQIIQFQPTQNVPEIKVIDFLTGLFRMFNLTAFTQDDGTIKVETLDNFYASGTSYVIDDYVDMEQSQVDLALPYKEISFSFKSTKSLLASVFNQINNREWGSLNYDNSEALDGGIYKIEVPFEHMQFERLTDGTGGTIKNVQVGYMIDENLDPIKGEPLLFYAIYNNSSPQTISFLPDASNETEVPESSYTGYYIPSNSVALDSSTDDTALHFGLETNEWQPSGNFSGTLFEDLYKTYIEDVFNTKRRLTKLKAFLPLKILRNYTLADRFIVRNRSYKINSITTNLKTGESQLELLNEV